MVMWYVFCGFMIVFGLVGLFGRIAKMNSDSKNEIIDEMYKNGDISETVYKKYKFNRVSYNNRFNPKSKK